MMMMICIFFAFKAFHKLSTMPWLSPMDYHWNKYYSHCTNRANQTNGQVEYTTTQPEANGNILRPHNEMAAFHEWNTNGKNAIPLVPIVPLDK